MRGGSLLDTTVCYAFQEMDFAFGRRLERIPVTLSWGFKAIDTGSLNRVYEHTDAVLDPAANFTSPEAQKWLLNLCIGLQNWSEKPDSPIVLNSVQCPMPLVWQIAATRQISFPMPSEVCKVSSAARRIRAHCCELPEMWSECFCTGLWH